MCNRTLVAVFSMLLISHAVGAVEMPAPTYQPFPDGYGYMQQSEIKALTVAVGKGDHKVVREHGWKLWAGIMQPARGLDWPVWYTWPNTKAAFAPESPALTAEAEAKPAAASKSLLRLNMVNTIIPVNEKTPFYPIPPQVTKAYPNATDPKKCGQDTICDGTHVLFNGDIMIPTESLSQEAMAWIRNPERPLYKRATLDKAHADSVHLLGAPQRYIVTKHMYWPVKATGLSAIPVWNDDFDARYTAYAGYENWKTLIAIDPSGKQVGKTAQVSYLHGVLRPDKKTPWPIVTAKAKVYALKDFYYHQVSKADWASFDEADKAIIEAASYWAYNKPFVPGDYLVTIAMHVNTKEIPSWALQSVWWSDRPNDGPYAADRPRLPRAKGPWAHYLLVDSYGIPAKPRGNQPVAMNPYIELAIHPVATNCNNCHMRAGWPTGKQAGHASYQNPDCPDLLATLNPNSVCLKPLTLTDFQWIIPDRAIAQ